MRLDDKRALASNLYLNDEQELHNIYTTWWSPGS